MKALGFSYMLYILLVLNPTTTTALFGPENSSDLQSLLAFKASADAYGNLDANWTINSSFCGWMGVSCGPNRLRVVSLRLDGLSLRGTISPRLANLTFLSYLDLSKNSLAGGIPESLGRLPRLVMLYLADNLLSGAIPPGLFNMSSVVHVNLGRNNLSGPILVRDGTIALPRIRTFSLSGNKLTGEIPAGFARCSSLRRMLLSDNELTGSVPGWFGNLSELEALSITRNKLTGSIPVSLGNLTKLESLSLYSNQMEGEIPVEFGNLASLWRLNLDQNRIRGPIPTAVLNMTMLAFLSLSMNYLTGAVPATIGAALPRLRQLHLASNRLTRGLDFIASLTNCKDLEDVEVLHNEFRGAIPDACGNLSANLLYFHVSENRLDGRIPASLGNLTGLISLALSVNQLTGAIPLTLMRLKRLQGMYLGANRLSGMIPPDIGLMRSLVEISLSKNQLSGSIPDSVGNITGLQIFAVAENRLSSSIPSSLWSLTGLVTLDMYQNRFEGPLPVVIANLKSVDYIDLWSNRLSGEISSYVGELQMITYLDLSNNSFHGQIPRSLGRLISVKYLNLSHNFFSGAIPKSLANLSFVGSLDLSFNELEGEVPEGKPFSNASVTFLAGNSGLCGSPNLGFPPCRSTDSNTRPRRLIFVLEFAGSALVLFMCTCAVVRFHTRAKGEMPSHDDKSPCSNYHRLIPYAELVRGTRDFSEDNVLGRGSFGTVYKGSLDDGLTVAVKVLNLEVKGASRSFDAECRTLGKVRHRNLVKIISTCSNLEFKALVLEFMANGSLDEWLHSRNDSLMLLERINVAVDVSSAVDYLHNHSPRVVVHRDLKPSNVLLDENMVARVTDFGVAKLLLGESKSLVSTSHLGTIGYIAPECGSTGEVTTSGDVYSFGILLLELFTGRKPVDTMFGGGLSLRQWVRDAHPNDVLRIVDSRVLTGDSENQQCPDAKVELQKCLESIFELGLDCSEDSPKNRIPIKTVVARLREIKMKNLSRLDDLVTSKKSHHLLK